jgi:hypothetical protein
MMIDLSLVRRVQLMKSDGGQIVTFVRQEFDGMFHIEAGCIVKTRQGNMSILPTSDALRMVLDDKVQTSLYNYIRSCLQQSLSYAYFLSHQKLFSLAPSHLYAR